MNRKQRVFLDTLLETRSVEQAKERAGYQTMKAVRALLHMPEARQYLRGRAVASEEEVAAFFSSVMRGETAADKKLPGVKEQLKAAELLAKHFGMFGERLDGEGGGEMEFIGDEKLED